MYISFFYAPVNFVFAANRFEDVEVMKHCALRNEWTVMILIIIIGIISLFHHTKTNIFCLQKPKAKINDALITNPQAANLRYLFFEFRYRTVAIQENAYLIFAISSFFLLYGSEECLRYRYLEGRMLPWCI